jgi:hypothetical protein
MLRILLGAFMGLLLSLNGAMANSSFYNVGKNLSTNLARSTWNNFNQDCYNVDEFLRILGESRGRTTNQISSMAQSGNTAVQDFGSGYVEGLVNVLESVINLCVAQCSKIGSFAGEQSAFVYCEVSQVIGSPAIFTGMTDIPNIGCGEPYRTSCESKFYSRAKGMCSYYANGTTFERYYRADYGGCCSYNPKEEGWRRW